MRLGLFPAFAFVCLGCGPSRSAGYPAPVVTAPPPAVTDARYDMPVNGAVHVGRPADQVGLATWYGKAFAGKKTANGERFDPSGYTAAHRTLPFGTWVEVRRVETGKSVRVRINDRGPWGHEKRIIDLAERAARDIDLVSAGVTRVEVRVLELPR